MSAAVGNSLHLGEHDRSTLTDAYEKTLADWNLYLFDGFGSFDPDLIYNRIEYLQQVSMHVSSSLITCLSFLAAWMEMSVG